MRIIRERRTNKRTKERERKELKDMVLVGKKGKKERQTSDRKSVV